MFNIQVNDKKISKLLKEPLKYGYKEVPRNVFIKEEKIFGGTIEFIFSMNKVTKKFDFNVQIISMRGNSDAINKNNITYLKNLWDSNIDILISKIGKSLFDNNILILEEL